MGVDSGSRRQVTADPSTVDDSRCTVLHVDMDAFFAFVELRRHPELRGRPMMVAGAGRRSVVLSATYEARAVGVRSGMPTGRAEMLCPGIAVVPPEHGLYHEVSLQVMAIFADVTPLVEPLSVDEAFLDVSGAGRTGGRPAVIAAALRRRIRHDLGLVASVGAASTKFVAKLSSGLAKPDGLLVVPPQDVTALLHPLPVRALWGVGPAAEKMLLGLGLQTVGDIAATDRRWLIRRVGEATGSKLHDLSRGIDDRTVTPDVDEISLGAETTFIVDTADRVVLRRELLGLADRTARRARAGGRRGRTVAIKVRYDDFSTVTRSLTLPEPTDLARTIHAVAVRLLDKVGDGRRIRLLGVRLENLGTAADTEDQLSFDDVDAPGDGVDGAAPPGADWRGAENTVDRVSARFGAAALRPASLLGAVRPRYSLHSRDPVHSRDRPEPRESRDPRNLPDSRDPLQPGVRPESSRIDPKSPSNGEFGHDVTRDSPLR